MNTQQSSKTFKTVRPKTNERMYEFENSEALTQCIIALYRKARFRDLKSSLYKMPDCYRLIIKQSNPCNSPVYIKEFSRCHSNSAIELSVTKEYGKLLIKNNAVEIFGKAFNRAT